MSSDESDEMDGTDAYNFVSSDMSPDSGTSDIPDWKRTTDDGDALADLVDKYGTITYHGDGEYLSVVADFEACVEWLNSPKDDEKAEYKRQKAVPTVNKDCEIKGDYGIDESPEHVKDTNTADLVDSLDECIREGAGILEGHDTDKVSADLKNLPDSPEIDIATDVARTIGDYVVLHGRVVTVTDSIPYPEVAAYSCTRCGTLTRMPQSLDSQMGITPPHECQGCERQGPFDFAEQKSEYGKFVEMQVKQTRRNTVSDGTTPIKVRVLGEYVDVSAGEDVTIKGRMSGNPDGNLSIDPWIEGFEVETEDTDPDTDITPEEEEEIKAIACSENPLERVAELVAPSHFGDTLAKKSIALQTIGAATTYEDDGSRNRGEIHILMIGDPGTGKTDLQNAAEDLWTISERTANTSTEVGVTHSADRKEVAGQETWIIRGGSAPKADSGLLIMDEIDSIDWNLDALDTMMESGKLYANKAGMSQTLQAEASVLAAGNPKHGRFDFSEDIVSQMDFPSDVLDRFDVIIPFSDEPDPDTDEELAKQILNPDTPDTDSDTDPQELLLKYSEYAAQYEPTVEEDSDAEELLAEIFAGIRTMSDTDVSKIAMNARNLESLRRLSMAHARLRLADKVEVQDVKTANSILQETLALVGYDVDVIENAGKDDSDDDRSIYDEEQESVQESYDEDDEEDPERKKLERTIRNTVQNSSKSMSGVIGAVSDKNGEDPDTVEHRIEEMKKSGDIVSSGEELRLI